MNRISLSVGLALSILLEVSLLCAFIPSAWLNIDQRFVTDQHQADWSQITHPALDYEIVKVYQDHPWLKPGFLGLKLVLLAGNSWLVLRLWKALRRSS
jgi:hypothetical protein